MSFNLSAFQRADDPVMTRNVSLNELWHSALTPESISQAITRAEHLAGAALIDLMRWYQNTFGILLTYEQLKELNGHTRGIVAAQSLMGYLGKLKAMNALPPEVAALHVPELIAESELCEDCTCSANLVCAECNVPWPCETVLLTAEDITRIDGVRIEDD